MGRYYYLVSGLADISFDDGATLPDACALRQEILAAATAADRKLLELPLLENDCRRLSALIEGRPVDESMPAGCLSDDLLNETVQAARAGEPAPKGVPPFMYEISLSMLYSGAADRIDDNQTPALDRLLAGYYCHGMTVKNAFVRDWFSFNLDLNNIRAAMAARKHGLDVQKAVIGTNGTAVQLKTSGARDWGLSGQLDFFDDLQRISEEKDLAKRERQVDELRWNWLETNSFFSYFTVEFLFSYLQRLSIAQRWSTMDYEGGAKMLRTLVGELKQQIQVPSEFRNN